jgi:hypothetical protein
VDDSLRLRRSLPPTAENAAKNEIEIK